MFGLWYLLLLPSCLALRTLEPPPPASSSRETVVEGWVNVRTNHFDASDNSTFPMRYYYNRRFSGPNIVIYVGGEWSISPGWMQAGLPYELASWVHAGLFYTEHRYYGQTRPTEDTGVANLRYLTVDQSLADLAQFIQHVKSNEFENGRYKNAKVALVGCSYAGSMATWMRLAYPHLVDAAFSDSGPLHAQEDFPEYLEVITEALRTQGGEQCLSSVEQAMEQLAALLDQPTGPARVSELFRTCTPLNASSALDSATFFWFGITETFAYLVQYARPGNIADACAVLTDSTVSDPVQRLANWITSQPYTQPCIESRYREVVASHTDTSYDAPDSVMRLWTYQTCVEYGWYQTTSSSRQPFLSTVPLEYFHQMCQDFFTPYFNPNQLRQGIDRTNLLFAGLDHMPDRVVTVQGSHDPWSPMGPNVTHATSSSPVYVVSQISHCRAVQPTGNSDTEELEETKLAVLSHMREFILGPLDVASGVSRNIASLALIVFLMLLV